MSIINKYELVKIIVDQLNNEGQNFTQKDVLTLINTLLSTIQQLLIEGKEIRLIGYITFKAIKRNARTGVNPRTGEAIHIPSRNSAKAILGKKIIESVRDAFHKSSSI